MTHNGMRPIHPGEILREEYLEPLGMSVNALSKALHVPATRMNELFASVAVSAPIPPCGWLVTLVPANGFG